MGRTDPASKHESMLLTWLRMARDLRRQGWPDGRRPSRYLHDGAEDYLLQHGGFHTPQDRPAWVRKGPDKQCFANARRLVIGDGEARGLRYAEGWAWAIVPMHHAWCVTPEGEVVDPTWPRDDRTGLAYLGVAFDIDDVVAAHASTGCVLLDHKRDYPILRGVAEGVFA